MLGVKDLRCSRPEDECGSSRRSNQRVPLITRGWIAAVGVGKWEDVKPNLSALAWCVVCWGRKKKTKGAKTHKTKKPTQLKKKKKKKRMIMRKPGRSGMAVNLQHPVPAAGLILNLWSWTVDRGPWTLNLQPSGRLFALPHFHAHVRLPSAVSRHEHCGFFPARCLMIK